MDLGAGRNKCFEHMHFRLVPVKSFQRPQINSNETIGNFPLTNLLFVGMCVWSMCVCVCVCVCMQSILEVACYCRCYRNCHYYKLQNTVTLRVHIPQELVYLQLTM